jgi:hypothetical protein
VSLVPNAKPLAKKQKAKQANGEVSNLVFENSCA